MLPECCYGLGGSWVQGQSQGSTTRLESQTLALVPSSTLSQIVERYATPQGHCTSQARGAPFRGQLNSFYPEMVYSVAEKPREPLNEVRTLTK